MKRVHKQSLEACCNRIIADVLNEPPDSNSDLGVR